MSEQELLDLISHAHGRMSGIYPQLSRALKECQQLDLKYTKWSNIRASADAQLAELRKIKQVVPEGMTRKKMMQKLEKALDKLSDEDIAEMTTKLLEGMNETLVKI